MDAGDVRALAHDLCNDLMLLVGSLDLLTTCQDLSPAAREHTEAAVRAAEEATERLQHFQAAHAEVLRTTLDRVLA